MRLPESSAGFCQAQICFAEIQRVIAIVAELLHGREAVLLEQLDKLGAAKFIRISGGFGNGQQPVWSEQTVEFGEVGRLVGYFA